MVTLVFMIFNPTTFLSGDIPPAQDARVITRYHKWWLGQVTPLQYCDMLTSGIHVKGGYSQDSQ